MRRYSFFTGALSAVVTFVALSAFTDRRPWTGGARWPQGWHRHYCDREDRYNDDRSSDDRGHEGPHRGYDRRQTTPADSATKEFNFPTDSGTNR